MKLTIGADPEFLFMRTPTTYCSAHTETCFKSLSSTAKVGRDGARIPVEIRPSPFPYEKLDLFFREIKTLMKQMGRYVSSHEWYGLYGGSYPCGHAIGGHIHFGFNYTMNSKSTILKRLDDYLAPILLLLAEKDPFIRRASSGYGRLSKMESKSYGFEYRTPYCFLTTEEATKGIFTLAGLIVKKHRELPDLRVLRDSEREWNRCNKTHFFKLYKEKIKPNLMKIIRNTLSKHRRYQLRIYSVLNHVDRGNLLTMGNVLHNFFPNKFEKAGHYLRDNIQYATRIVLENIKKAIESSISRSLLCYLSRPLFIYSIEDSYCNEPIIFVDSYFKTFFRSVMRSEENTLKNYIMKELTHGDFRIRFGTGIDGQSGWDSLYGIGITRRLINDWKTGQLSLIHILLNLTKLLNTKSHQRSR